MVTTHCEHTAGREIRCSFAAYAPLVAHDMCTRQISALNSPRLCLHLACYACVNAHRFHTCFFAAVFLHIAAVLPALNARCKTIISLLVRWGTTCNEVLQWFMAAVRIDGEDTGTVIQLLCMQQSRLCNELSFTFCQSPQFTTGNCVALPFIHSGCLTSPAALVSVTSSCVCVVPACSCHP